ncbi:MAG: type II secretion system protein GspM [Hyphomonas sp.]
MKDFWLARSARERLLILMAALLVTALLLNVLLVRPLRTARQNAELSLAVASRTLDAVSAARANVGTEQTTGGPVVSGEDLRARLVDLASQRGLAVSRLQSNERGAIIVQFDQASVQTLFAWLEAAERQLGAEPAQASIFADTSGMVRASFEFRGGAS